MSRITPTAPARRLCRPRRSRRFSLARSLSCPPSTTAGLSRSRVESPAGRGNPHLSAEIPADRRGFWPTSPDRIGWGLRTDGSGPAQHPGLQLRVALDRAAPHPAEAVGDPAVSLPAGGPAAGPRPAGRPPTRRAAPAAPPPARGAESSSGPFSLGASSPGSSSPDEHLVGAAWSTSTVPGRASEVSREAMFTTGPNTSPRRLTTSPYAIPPARRGNGSSGSSPRSVSSSAISAAAAGRRRRRGSRRRWS